jgi:hypothetical protein
MRLRRSRPRDHIEGSGQLDVSAAESLAQYSLAGKRLGSLRSLLPLFGEENNLVPPRSRTPALQPIAFPVPTELSRPYGYGNISQGRGNPG